jgi:hypothetical protein
MWSLINSLLVKIVAIRLVWRILGGTLLLPFAFLLKVIGYPILFILAIVALPLLFALFTFGMPLFLVLIVGGIILALLPLLLSLGLGVLKIGIFVVLPLFLAWKLATMIRDRVWQRPEPVVNDPPAPDTGPIDAAAV